MPLLCGIMGTDFEQRTYSGNLAGSGRIPAIFTFGGGTRWEKYNFQIWRKVFSRGSLRR